MNTLKYIVKEAPALWKIIFIICFILSASLIVISFYLPPMGEIEPTVLQAVGELLAFPTVFAACECIMTGLGVKITKGDTTVEVKGKNDETNS